MKLKMVTGFYSESKRVVVFATNLNFVMFEPGQYRDAEDGWYVSYNEVQPNASIVVLVETRK